jgi:hypothetical protein
MIAIDSGLPSATAQQNCALTVTAHRATVLLRTDADCMAGLRFAPALHGLVALGHDEVIRNARGQNL